MRRTCTVSSTLACILALVLPGPQNAHAQHWKNKITKIVAPPAEGQAGEEFGWAVAIDDDHAVAGAYRRDNWAGAVYVFRHTVDGWTPMPTLTAYDREDRDEFGRSVAISGSYLIVGAPNDSIAVADEGTAYIYELVGGTWTPKVPKLHVSPGGQRSFGRAVAIDGDFAIVGATGTINSPGAAYVFRRNTAGVWVLDATLTASDGGAGDGFGASVAIEGSYAVVGAVWAPGNTDSTGAAYLFERSGATWSNMTETAKLEASDGVAWDFFGVSVSVSGNRAFAGAINYGEIGPSGNGAVYVFEKPGGGWSDATETEKIVSSDSELGERGDFFGISVAARDDRLVVGAGRDDDIIARSAGCVYVLETDGSEWTEKKIRTADADTSDFFGSSVAISDNYAIGGAYADDDYGEYSGSAYILEGPFYDDRYFVHLADLHAAHDDNFYGSASGRWEKVLKKVLSLRPPPEFVMVAGDLVEYGENWWLSDKGEKNYNRLVGSQYLDIDVLDGEHYLFDDAHAIRIIFTPGNHDYRIAKYGPTRTSLSNYPSKIYVDGYYHDTIGQYAVFSLNTRHDFFADKSVLYWPEGIGILGPDLTQFDDDLDALDDANDEVDTSGKTKIVMMHHPHETESFGANGEFLQNKDPYLGLLSQYGVDFALYGHLHKGLKYKTGPTRCYVAEAAKDGGYNEVSLHSGDGSNRNSRLYGVINVKSLGFADTYGCEQYGDTTGLLPADTSVVRLGIPESQYYCYYFTNDYTGDPDYLTEMSVIKSDTMDYTFVAEALEADSLTFVLENINLDGTRSSYRYDGIPMLYEETPTPKGSIATVNAPTSVIEAFMTVEDPDETVTVYTPIITMVEEDTPTPAHLHLFQNYPNPFNPSTMIMYDLPTASRVRLEIFDVLGRRVVTPVDEFQSAGRKTVRWNGTSRGGSEVASGVYFYRLTAGSETVTRKMVLLR